MNTIWCWFGVAWSHDMEAADKKIIISANEYSYKIEEALKYDRKRCVLFVQFTNTIFCWFGVMTPHDMEDIEKLY